MTRRAPCARYGGKSNLAPHLIECFPESADLYLEPFFGTGSVFFTLPRGRYKDRMVNDRDKWVVTFFRVLRDNPDELIRRCELTPYAFDEFKAGQKYLNNGTMPDDPIEVARLFWMLTLQSFGQLPKPRTGWRRSPGGSRRAATSVSALPSFVGQLRSAEIDNKPAVEFLQSWVRPNTFIYADPPYVMDSRVGGKAYMHEMTDVQHRELATELKRCVSIGAKVAISGYNCDLYEELFEGWTKVEFETVAASSAGRNTGKSCRRTDVLWLSYPRPKPSRSFLPHITTAVGKALAKQLGRR